MFGGPTSGTQNAVVQNVHNENRGFVRTSPQPSQTFDHSRGASVPLNSYNNISQFMPGKEENPRLTVLQNFREINRIMTSQFMKNKTLESKYKSRIPRDVMEKKAVEDAASQNMT